MTTRSFSLGRAGETLWNSLRAAYVLSRHNGVIALVASDSRDVRDEVRRRLESMAPRVQVIEPGKGVTLAVHACAKAREEGEKVPVVWIEAPVLAPTPDADMRWIEALVVLNQTRDALQMHGPCHVVLAGPQALHHVVATRAPDLTSFMGHVLLLDDTLENLVTQQGTLTWLHLSDLHVQHESWQQDHVLDALMRDLPQLLEERELRPDLLFVTGDVAARGRLPEYDGAFIMLDALSKQLGLERRQHVFVVPGNHDVDRGKIGRLAKRDHASLLELGPQDLREAVGELLGDAKEFALYGERLEDWCVFSEKLLGRARSVSFERPWRSDVVEVGGLPVGVLSLCTAWASGPDDRKGCLILGERQLHDMVAEARDGGAQLVIALMHHPLHWLHDGEHSAIRGRLEREVDVVLHGHVHEAHTELHVAAGSAHVEIGAGASYAGMGEDPYHGFSVGRLDLAQGRLDVHCFTWSTRSGKWHADSGAPGADDHGRMSFPFALAGIAPATDRVSGQDVLSTRLRHAAAKVYSTVDFAGLGAGGPRKHVTLEQIFVPLRLAGKCLDSADPSWFGLDEAVLLKSDDLQEHDRVEYERDLVTEFRNDTFRRVTLMGLDSMLTAGRKIVVLGGPGSGKSTLTKYLVSTIAKRDGGPVPLLLTVRDWIAEGKREDLLDMAARQATTTLSIRTDREALETLCESGRALLIVDGVDEAADAAVRRDLRDRMHAFVARYPRVPVLVTSRVAGYHEVPLDAEFDELTLEPFDDAALEDFVHRWYDLVEADPAERLRKRVNLLHALEVEPRAKELARNPLMATLIGMVHFSHAQLPGDRAKLYGMMIELLLVTWPAERGREFADLHGTVQQPMLEKLALRLQEQRAAAQTAAPGHAAEVLVDIATLEEMLEECLAGRFPERSAPERRHLARRWGKWLVDGSGVLQEQQPGRVGFLHLLLMEYLAGQALLEYHLGGGYAAVAELVKERHHEPVWNETLLLMLGSENKNRELGQAVIERLLDIKSAEHFEWWTGLFGLALLREEVDVGTVHPRLLEAVRDMVLGQLPRSGRAVSKGLADVVRFSRVHGANTLNWLKGELEVAKGERLVGAWVLASEVLHESEVEALLEARIDVSSAVLALLDLSPMDSGGRWARRRFSRAIAFDWARSTPREGTFSRSFEGVNGWMGAIWIPRFIERAGWLALTTGVAAQGGLPMALEWRFEQIVCARARTAPSLSVSRLAGVNVGRTSHFQPGLAKSLSDESAQQLVPGLALGIIFDFSLNLAAYIEHIGDLVAQVHRDSGRESMQSFVQMYARHYARNFGWTLDRESGNRLRSSLGDTLLHSLPQNLCLRISPSDTTMEDRLSGDLRDALTPDKLKSFATHLLLILIADGHAALMMAPGLSNVPPPVIHALARARLENRWLNLFFTPLVEHATATRPLATNPDLHALLLTYGLIQYQTTWQWPDCPHWRSWFSSQPPDHWLPAHVYHLVRSIQDPTNPTHRASADAALDRNDWPELAQALRDNTLVPTPPEVLALFDHDEPE